MLKKFWSWGHDFIGALIFHATQASGVGHDFKLTVTGTTPTATVVDGSGCGELTLANSNATEVQNICLSHDDKLDMDIDLIRTFRARIKAGQTTLNAATTFSIGLASDRSDTIESIAAFALFKVLGTNEVLISTDDGTTDLSDKATGISISSIAWTDLVIDFSNKKDVKFYVNGQPVCQNLTFDMSNYTGSLQPYMQLQKTSSNNIDSIIIDYIEVEGVRSLPSAT